MGDLLDDVLAVGLQVADVGWGALLAERPPWPMADEQQIAPQMGGLAG